MSGSEPAVFGAESDDDRLAPERIPPDAEEVDRRYLEHRRQRGIEGARPCFVGLGSAIRAKAVVSGRDGAVIGGAVFRSGVARAAALQKAANRRDLVPGSVIPVQIEIDDRRERGRG